MAKPITIGDDTFPTKKAALEAIRELRDRYPDGVPLGLDDDRFMRSVLALHPEAAQKIGLGISHFTVATESEFGGRNRHFVVHRVLGPATDFSFMHCLDGRSKDRNDRMLALRQAIKEQTWAFRDHSLAGGPVICPYEGTELHSGNCHIDHQPPKTFDFLVMSWLSNAGLLLEQVAITPPADNQLVSQMTDEAQKYSWRLYHHQHAELRLLSVRGNLSGAKKRST